MERPPELAKTEERLGFELPPRSFMVGAREKSWLCSECGKVWRFHDDEDCATSGRTDTYPDWRGWFRCCKDLFRREKPSG